MPILTRTGIYALALVGILALAGIVSLYNNILLVTASLVGAAVVVDGVLTVFNLWKKKIHIRLTVSQRMHAGDESVVELSLHNKSRWFPVYWLTVADVSSSWAQCPIAVLTRLGRQQQRMEKLAGKFSRRGKHVIGRVHCSSFFPLGFWERRLQVDLQESVLVYPRYAPDGTTRVQQMLNIGYRTTMQRDDDPDLDNLRPYVAGDPPRNIHWATSAKQGALMVRESMVKTHRRINFRLVIHPHCDQTWYEHAISVIATLSRFGAHSDYDIGLQAGTTVIAPGKGVFQHEKIITALALLSEFHPTIFQVYQGAAHGAIGHDDGTILNVEGTLGAVLVTYFGNTVTYPVE